MHRSHRVIRAQRKHKKQKPGIQRKKRYAAAYRNPKRVKALGKYNDLAKARRKHKLKNLITLSHKERLKYEDHIPIRLLWHSQDMCFDATPLAEYQDGPLSGYKDAKNGMLYFSPSRIRRINIKNKPNHNEPRRRKESLKCIDHTETQSHKKKLKTQKPGVHRKSGTPRRTAIQSA